jgi:hypothetical protein
VSDTMRRIRSYKHGTDVRGGSRMFQAKMLAYLVQPNKHPVRKKKREIAG